MLTAAEEVAIWVPGRLCLAAVRDQQLTQFLLDSVFKNGLLPASLSPAAAAKRWAALYMECKPQVGGPVRHRMVRVSWFRVLNAEKDDAWRSVPPSKHRGVRD